MMNSISPVDGRYAKKLENVNQYFSEIGIIKAKILVEVDYLEFISTEFSKDCDIEKIRKYIHSLEDFLLYDNIKMIESVTKHDTKAIEYFLREVLTDTDQKHLIPFIHFGLTSQDVVSFSYNYNILNFRVELFEPLFRSLTRKMLDIGQERFENRFITRTHGQPAIIANSFNDEVFVLYRDRIKAQYLKLERINQEVKFGGAIGNLDAHYTVKPTNWESKMNDFMKNFGLKRQIRTTQIENYEHLVEYLDITKRINNILIDFCRDFWYYISIGYIKIKKDENSIGSSTMPQKINPILFENAEGNLEYANCQISFLSDKLLKSRLQRDLTDSTVMRNIGVVFSHCVLAYENIIDAISNTSPNIDKMESDVQENGQVLSEKIQTILRFYGHSDAYEIIKGLSMGEKIPMSEMQNRIDDIINENTFVSIVKTNTPSFNKETEEYLKIKELIKSYQI